MNGAVLYAIAWHGLVWHRTDTIAWHFVDEYALTKHA